VKTTREHSTLMRKSVLAVVAIIFVVASIAVMVAARWYIAPDFMQQAMSALKRGDQVAAISALRSHLKNVPDSTTAKLRLAALLADSSPDEALRYLHQIPQTDTQRLSAVRQIAIRCIILNRTADAENALKELLSAQPDNFGAQLSLAELYFQLEKPDMALPHALEAARLEPDRAQTFLLIAEIHDELQHPQEMIGPLQKAVAIEPDFYEAHLNLAYAFHKTGQLAEAQEQAQWCLQINARAVAALRILASVERDLGRFDDAEKHLERALKIEPDDVDCRILESDLLLYHRHPKQAYENLKGIYNAQQGTARYLGALARAAASAGERDEARKIHETLAKLLQAKRPAP